MTGIKKIKKAKRACPICNVEKGLLLNTQKIILPEGHPLRTGFDVIVCDGCGFAYADVGATQEDFDTYYAQFSKYEDRAISSGGESAIDAARFSVTAETIAGYIKNRNSRILDIGCANGGLLSALKKFGFTQLNGVDPSAACVDYISSKLQIQAYTGSLFSLPDIGSFDIVILSHVLEHVRDLEKSLQSINAVLHEKGIVYTEVPDATRFSLFNYSPFQEFNAEHINYFSVKNLKNLFETNGFSNKDTGEKVMEISKGNYYPAIFGFFEKEKQSCKAALEKDISLVKSLEDYCSESSTELTRINSVLQDTIRKSPEIIVWGTGQFAMKLLAQTCLCNATIKAFVDGNPINQGRILRSSPIISPEKVKALNFPIVITSIIHEKAIFDTIRNILKLDNEIISLSKNQ